MNILKLLEFEHQIARERLRFPAAVVDFDSLNLDVHSDRGALARYHVAALSVVLLPQLVVPPRHAVVRLDDRLLLLPDLGRIEVRLILLLLSRWLLLAASSSGAILAAAGWNLLRAQASVALGDGEGRLSRLCRQGQEMRVESIILELG